MGQTEAAYLIAGDHYDDVTGYSIEGEKIAQEAERQAGPAVVRIAQAAESAVTDEPKWRDSPETVQRADPALGLRAARRLGEAVRREIGEYIQACRGHGIGWQEVGVLLALQSEAAATATPLAVVAFEYAIGKRDQPWATPADALMWTCATCGQTVHDGGPGAGSPAEAEQGHARGCAQLAAAVADWDANWTQEQDT
jgi:hypothetical protein